MLARDREVFGADRGAVLRWALACRSRSGLGGHRGGAYCFGRHGDHSDHVGPVVAEDRESALALVRACLSLPRRRPLILDARVEPAWLAALGALGFREQRPFTRMYLGDARPAARPALEPAVLGPEFGVTRPSGIVADGARGETLMSECPDARRRRSLCSRRSPCSGRVPARPQAAAPEALVPGPGRDRDRGRGRHGPRRASPCSTCGARTSR